MAATTQGNEFHEDQILDLAHGWASTIWFKICCNDKFRGIEWGSLSSELVTTHHKWFNIDELAKLSDGKPYSKDALTSAVQRNAPGVLCAFYQSLCATQNCGGAGQHASIAEVIEKETLMATVTKAYSYPPASNQLQSYSSWPTTSELASAERDFMRQASVGNVPAQLAHQKTTEAQWCRSGMPPMKEPEEWEGVVAFICHHFGENAPRDVVSALHREVVPCHRSHSFPPSSQQLSEAIQQVVKERCMTWFQFAHYLLLSRTTRPFVFKIVRYSRGGIRSVFKQELSKHLGSDWYRLACEMGLPKTDVDSIEDQKDITLSGKIDVFLTTYQFPAFKCDEETTEFLVEALERACLSSIAAAVRRDLKNALQRAANTGWGSGSSRIEGSSPQSSPSFKQNTSMPSKTDNSNGPGPAPNIDMSHVEAQSNVGMQPSTPQGNHTPSQTADMAGASGSSHMKDPPPPSSQSPELNNLSQSKDASIASESERSFGLEYDSKNVPSLIEAHSGGVMQVPAPQGNRTPDQSSIPPNPLWEAAKTPPVELAERSAVPTATGVSLTQQSRHQPKTSPENADNEHSDADATSEPGTIVERRSESPSRATVTPTQPSLKQDITSHSLILPSSQDQMYPCAHRKSLELSLPDRVGITFQDDILLPPQSLNIVKGGSNDLGTDEALPDSEPEERDSVTVRPSSQPPSTNSAQCIHALNTIQNGSPKTGHKAHPSPSTIPTKEHSLLSNPASHPSQQSAPNEDNLDSETSDDDDALSDVTYQSSTSTSTTVTSATAPNVFPPSTHRRQPPTTHPNRSVNVPSCMEPAAVELTTSKVPSRIEASAEAYPSAAPVVEAANKANTTAAPASCDLVEQPKTFSCGGGSSTVSSTLQDVHRQDSDYLGSNQLGYQGKQDSEESISCAVNHIGSSAKEEEMLAYVSRQVGQKWSMLARYAGLEEDEIQRIKQSTQDRSCAIMKTILERLTLIELLDVVQKHMRMLNTAAKLQHFLGHQVNALPDLVHNEIDPQQYSRTLLLASQCVSEHWKELAQYLGVDPHQHWDVLEESSDGDEKCHEVLLLWLSGRRATLQELLEAVESTSAAAGSLQRLIEMAC